MVKDMKTLTVRPPWSTIIALGLKTIENREWQTSYRGPILIHAGKTYDEYAAHYINRQLGWSSRNWPQIERGGIVAVATLAAIVTDIDDPWFEGTYGWVFKNIRRLPFVPCRGYQFLFDIPDAFLREHYHGLIDGI